MVFSKWKIGVSGPFAIDPGLSAVQITTESGVEVCAITCLSLDQGVAVARQVCLDHNSMVGLHLVCTEIVDPAQDRRHH